MDTRRFVNKVSTRMKTVWVVAAALTDAEGRVFVQRRPPKKALAGLWEFPGGKVEVDETPENALMRELHEELRIQVASDALMPLAFSTAAHGDQSIAILLYRCCKWRGDLRLIEATAGRWANPSELVRLPMPPADGPLVKALVAER